MTWKVNFLAGIMGLQDDIGFEALLNPNDRDTKKNGQIRKRISDLRNANPNKYDFRWIYHNFWIGSSWNCSIFHVFFFTVARLPSQPDEEHQKSIILELILLDVELIFLSFAIAALSFFGFLLYTFTVELFYVCLFIAIYFIYRVLEPDISLLLMACSTCSRNLANVRYCSFCAKPHHKSCLNEHRNICPRHPRFAKLNSSTSETDIISVTSKVSNPRIVVSGIPKTLNTHPDQLVIQLFAFLGVDNTEYTSFILDARIAKSKNQLSASKSLIIDLSSDNVCEKLLQLSARKRKLTPFSAKAIFGSDEESAICVDKMLAPYYHNLAFLARQIKRHLGWDKVWINND